MYKQIAALNGEWSDEIVQRLSDNAFIPFDPDNTDYQEFLRWCEAGNTPEPADQPE